MHASFIREIMHLWISRYSLFILQVGNIDTIINHESNNQLTSYLIPHTSYLNTSILQYLLSIIPLNYPWHGRTVVTFEIWNYTARLVWLQTIRHSSYHPGFPKQYNRTHQTSNRSNSLNDINSPPPPPPAISRIKKWSHYFRNIPMNWYHYFRSTPIKVVYYLCGRVWSHVSLGNMRWPTRWPSGWWEEVSDRGRGVVMNKIRCYENGRRMLGRCDIKKSCADRVISGCG